jgi:hypothetical protein
LRAATTGLLTLALLAVPFVAHGGAPDAPTIAVLPMSSRLEQALRAALSAWQMNIVRIEATSATPLPSTLQAMNELARRHQVDAIVWVVGGAGHHGLWVYDARSDTAATRVIPARGLSEAHAAALALSVKTLLRAWEVVPQAGATPATEEPGTWQRIEAAPSAPTSETPGAAAEAQDEGIFQDDLSSELGEASMNEEELLQQLADPSVQELSEQEAQVFRAQRARIETPSLTARVPGAGDASVDATARTLAASMEHSPWQLNLVALLRLGAHGLGAEPRYSLSLRYFPGGLDAEDVAPWVAVGAQTGLPTSIEHAGFSGNYWEVSGGLAVGMTRPFS